MVNLSAFIRYHATRTPDHTAIIFDGARISYAELLARTEALAGSLAAHGIGAGDVLAVLMKNSPAFIEAALATSYLGGVFLPINYRLAADEVAYIYDDGEAKLLLADTEFGETVAAIPSKMLLEDEAQADTRSMALDSGQEVPAGMLPPAGRPVSLDVHLGHYRPAQGGDAFLCELLLEVRGPHRGTWLGR